MNQVIITIRFAHAPQRQMHGSCQGVIIQCVLLRTKVDTLALVCFSTDK